jgi:tRNA A-37 threonylcarbamoyl transferase component Bud32
MMKCRYCGTSNPNGSVYCNHCGGAFATAPAGKVAAAAQGAGAAAASASAAVKAPPQAGTATATPTPPRSPNATGSLPPQTQLNRRYIVLATVGQGGMAAVYRALDTKTHRQVAIKEMSQDGLTPDEQTEALASFQAEADMLQRLRHPNLPRVWERFSDGARHYLVMEFVEGQTLEQRQQAANSKPLPEVEVMRYAQQICSVLAYLHSQRPPIIFRDLKPANVMVTPQGQVKLIDFGIARVFHPGRVKDTQVLGTPGFAPPEQYGKAQTDARADIYALGVTIYQLLTAYDPTTTPFTLPPAHTRNASISPHVEAALAKAIKLNRDERYASVAAFEHDLLHPDGFVFRNGQRARTVPELVALCRSYPQEAQDHLYTGRFEGWLRAIGQPDVARTAAVVVSAGGDRGAGLATFMAQATRPARPTGGARAAPPRGGTQGAQARPGQARPTQAPQGSQTWAAGIMGRVAAHTARRLMAQAAAAAATAVGTQILIEVRPRSANFGALMSGQRGRLALIISGQYGLPVTGRIVPLAPWLKVDRSTFAGPSTGVQLTVDTSQLPRAGTYTTNLQISSGTQQLYVPVSVEVLSTRVPNPPPTAPKRAAKPKGTKHGPSPSTPEWVKVILSWLTALGAAAWGTHLLVQAFASGALRVPSGFPLPAGMTLALASLVAMVLLAAPAGLVGRWGPNPLGRLASALIGATIGAALAWVVAQNGPFAGSSWPGMVAGTHLPLALVGLGLLGASTGVAIGVAPRYSKRILAAVRLVVRHRSTVLILGGVALGGWLGFTLLHPFFSGLLAPLGMIVGIVLAVILALRINRATRVAQRMPGRP